MILAFIKIINQVLKNIHVCSKPMFNNNQFVEL